MSRRHEARYAAYLYKSGKSLLFLQDKHQIKSLLTMRTPEKKYGSQNPRQKLLGELLVKNLIVGCSLPVSLVDNPHFRKFSADFDPKFTPPCRQTVTTSFIPQLVMEKRSKLEELLCSVSDVSLTTDEWTDGRAHAFMGVTAHIFNVMTGRSTSHLLAFRAFQGTHSGELMADELGAVINEI
jgi:hypothetical protein